MKIYIYGGVGIIMATIIAYNSPFWNSTCPAINRALVHWNVGPVLDCGGHINQNNSNKPSSVKESIRIQSIIEEYLNNNIMRQLPRDILETVLESQEFNAEAVVHITNKILNYKGTPAEISRAYTLRQQISKLPLKYIEAILKFEFHPNIVSQVLVSKGVTVVGPKDGVKNPWDLSKLTGKLSLTIPSAKEHYDTVPDNSEMCDHDGSINTDGIVWKFCICLKGAPKSTKNYVALRVKPKIDAELQKKKDDYLCSVTYYTKCVLKDGCYGYDPITRATPQQQLNGGPITEEDFALWKTLENKHMNHRGELAFGADIDCFKKPTVTVITE